MIARAVEIRRWTIDEFPFLKYKASSPRMNKGRCESRRRATDSSRTFCAAWQLDDRGQRTIIQELRLSTVSLSAQTRTSIG
jgi:hypothetical protein